MGKAEWKKDSSFVPAMLDLLLLSLPPGPSTPETLEEGAPILPQHLATDYSHWAEIHAV